MYSILFLIRNFVAHVQHNVRIQLDRYQSIRVFRGAELYAQNPNLIKKDENRVRADEQSTLPSLPTTCNEIV